MLIEAGSPPEMAVMFLGAVQHAEPNWTWQLELAGPRGHPGLMLPEWLLSWSPPPPVREAAVRPHAY